MGFRNKGIINAFFKVNEDTPNNTRYIKATSIIFSLRYFNKTNGPLLPFLEPVLGQLHQNYLGSFGKND